MEKKRTHKVTRAVTLDDLAAMVERAIAHKEDISAVDKHLDRLDDHVIAQGVRLDKMTNLLLSIRQDTADTKRALPKLASAIDWQDKAIVDLQARVARLEKKSGLRG